MEQTDDCWYEGEDCADLSGISPAPEKAILPTVDGSLALKQDAALPGASRGCLKYKSHDLERRLSYPKSA